jgi:hypothetical protein
LPNPCTFLLSRLGQPSPDTALTPPDRVPHVVGPSKTVPVSVAFVSRFETTKHFRTRRRQNADHVGTPYPYYTGISQTQRARCKLLRQANIRTTELAGPQSRPLRMRNLRSKLMSRERRRCRFIPRR